MTIDLADSHGARSRYEIRVRCVLSPALVSYLHVTDAVAVPRQTQVLIQVVTALKVGEIVELIASYGVGLIGIRVVSGIEPSVVHPAFIRLGRRAVGSRR